VTIARYSHEKGIDLLLKAWFIIEKQISDWRLDVFGDGDRTPYEQLIDELKINRKSCLLHGRTDDVEKEYCNSSIFVLSSRFEGFGMVLTEAMACGLPVVSFACPCGPKDIVRDGEDGFLVANGNVDDLAQQLMKLMADDNLRTAFAHRAYQNVQRFNMEHIALRWKSLFESCVKR
jgi:glycosyltransferase involved in cell wall biosynthesis